MQSPSQQQSQPNGRHRRPARRELRCPAHPEQRIEGNGRKYFLHLLTPEQLRERGMSDKKARPVIEAYPVLVLSNEWLEELLFPQCGTAAGVMRPNTTASRTAFAGPRASYGSRWPTWTRWTLTPASANSPAAKPVASTASAQTAK